MSKVCKIYYLLNEKGRKKSLLSNGDGKEQQCVETPITKELLDLDTVEVDKNGNVTFKVGHGAYKDSNTKKKAKIQTGEYSFKLGDEYYYKPYIDYEYETVYFSDLKTANELIKYEKDRLFNLKKSEEDIKEEYEVLLKEYNNVLEEYKKEQKKIEEIEREENRKREEENRKREEENRRKKEAERKEDLEWIENKGSDYLKQCIKLGYECKRKYMQERVKKEFPGFDLDFEDNADWKVRVSPSQEALNEVCKWVDKGYEAEIVWLTDSVFGSDHDYYNEFEPCEAIKLEFKGYNLIKII